MKIMVEVDYTDYSVLAVERIIAEARCDDAADKIWLMMVVRNTPPSAAALWADSHGSLEFAWLRMKYAAQQRLATLAEPLRGKGLSVETIVCESRWPLRALTEARSYHADRLVIGTHSFTGVKRATLEAVFDVIKNPDLDPEQGSDWTNRTAA